MRVSLELHKWIGVIIFFVLTITSVLAGEKQFDVDDSSSDDYHHGESSELLDGSMSTQGTPRMESAEATYNAAVVEKDQAQALADKSHFESLLVENKMLLTQQKEELENLRGTAKENSALRVQLHDLIMSTGALEEKLAHLSANSDAETGTVAHAMQWDYEERIRKLYAELEDALCAADERSEQLAAKSIEMEILESQAIELRTDSHRAGNRESSESEAAETQVIEMIQMLEVSVEHMEADGAALCELVKEKHDIIQKIQTQLRETLGRESGRIDSNNLVATLRKRFELDAAREQKHLELVKLLQQEISEILVELLGAREDAARAMQIANCEWMTLESNLAHATQSLAAHSESESRVVQDLQDDIEHLHRQLEATSASESKAQQDLDECKVQCAKVKGELEQAQIAKTAIQQDLDQGKVQLAKVGGEPEKMQQDPDEHKMQLSKVEGELQQLRNLKKATESKLQQDLDDCKGQLAHVKEMFVQKVDAEIQLKQAFDECTTNLSHVQLELEQVQTDKTEMSRVIDSFRKEDVSSQNSAKIALAISQSKLDSTTAELRTCEQELITVNEDLTRAKQESAVFEEQLATAQESLQKRGKELVTVNTVLTRAKQESAVFEEQLAIAHESLQKRGEEFYALHGEATALKTQLGTLQEELARVKSDLQASQGESTVLKTQLNSTELEVAQERDQVKALKDKLKQQQEEWKQQQVLLSALQAQIFFANEDLKKPQGEFQKLEKEYHAMRDEIVVLKAELGNLQEELTATHGELGRVKPELQASRAEALELQAQLYTVKADFKKVDSARQEDLSAAELEVAKLRQKLEASQDETIGLTTQLKRAVDDLVKVRQEEKDLQKEMANISQQWKSLQNERVAREEQLETVLQERLAAQHEALKLQSQIENAQEFMKTAVQEIQERNDLQKIHVRTVEQLETLKKGHDTLKVLLNDAEERSQELEEEREMLMHDAENLVAHLAATLEDKMQMIQEAFANRLQKAKIETDALVAQAKAEAEAAAPLQVQSMEQQARSHGKQQKSEQLQQKVPGGTADEGAVEILASEENLVEMETLATLAGLHEKTRHAFEELIEARQALEDLRDNMRSRLIVFEKECERATADRLSLAKATRSMQEELMAQHDLRMEVQFLRSDNEKVHRRLAQLLDNLQPDNKSFSSLHEWIPGVDPRGRGNAPLPSGAKRVSDTNRTPVSLSSNHWIHGESSSYDFAASSERAEMGVGVVGQGKSMRTISPTALYTMPDEALTKPGPDGGAPIFDDQYFMELLEAANPQMKEDGIVTL